MEAGDYVFRSALESLEGLMSPSARALAVFVAVKWVLTGESLFRIEDLIGDAALRRVYGELKEQHNAVLGNMRDPEDEPYHLFDFEQQLAEDLGILENDVLGRAANLYDIRLEPDRLRSLVAVTSDALARYEHGDGQLLEYMFDLMGVRD
jgi:hypothetical protein